MRLKKSFQLALNILLHSKLRSWLTIIGIVIGIGAVVAIVSISEGAQQQLESQLGNLGADILTVTSGMSRAQGPGGSFGGGMEGGPGGTIESSGTQKNLTARDINVIKTLDNVQLVMGQVSGTADITYGSKTLSDSRVIGVDTLVWSEITTSELSSGRFLTSGDTYSVIIGQRIAESSFEDTEVTLNSKLVIGGKSFNVVGILSDSSEIYIPIEVARIILEDVGDDEFNSILVKIENVNASDDTVDLITEKLMLSRGILQEKNVDFSISNPSTMQETMSETMNTMSIFLGAIAAISLLVGAIGIANTMFTSVLEKTNDIGVMKAIGAQNKDILSIFLFNSGLIGLVGGLGGVIVGFLASKMISTLTSTTTTSGPGGGMFSNLFGSTYVSPEIVIGALLISVLVGMIAGVIPAYRASKLNPVDALRYE
jgi:putative ABC transport system permease protein